MKTNFKFTDIRSNTKLREYALTKVASFEKLLGKRVSEGAVCLIEFRKSKHTSGDVCTAEITLEAQGEVYRVSKDEPTFEKAIDKVKDDILRGIRGSKEKNITTTRKGCGRVKKMLQENL